MSKGKRLTVMLLAGLILAGAACVYASSDDVPRIGGKELKGMMDAGTPVTILDNRPKADFNRGRIKDAVSLPWAIDVAAEAKKVVPADKPIVTYCACGAGESDSADVASQLIAVGFKDVRTLSDGWDAWVAAGYPVEKGKK